MRSGPEGQKPYVGLVYEPYMVGKTMHPLPVNGVVVVEPVHHPLDFGEVHLSRPRQFLRVDLTVAEETVFHRRHRGGRALGHVAVAELALNTHAAFVHGAGVDGVGKGNGLRGALPSPKGGLENQEIARIATTNPTMAVTINPTMARGNMFTLGNMYRLYLFLS